MGKSHFYAVRAGRAPGIYEDWPSAQAATTGFPGAVCKGFGTRQEAEEFLRQGGSQSGCAGSSQGQQERQQQQRRQQQQQQPGGKWWAVVAGRRTGVIQGHWSHDIEPLVTRCVPACNELLCWCARAWRPAGVRGAAGSC
jgi:hypothetical protein